MHATDEKGMSSGPSHSFFVLLLFASLGPRQQPAARGAARTRKLNGVKLGRCPAYPPPPLSRLWPGLSLASRSPLPSTPLSPPPPTSATPPAPPTKTGTGAVVEDGEWEQQSVGEDGESLGLGPGVGGVRVLWDPLLLPPLGSLPHDGDRSGDCLDLPVGMGLQAAGVDSHSIEKSEKA